MSRLLLISVLPLFAQLSSAQQTPDYHTAPFGPGGTWNVYQVVKEEMTWDKAREHAETMLYKVGDKEFKGHLVTLTSAAENSFVFRIADKEQYWAGLSDNEKIGGTEAIAARRKGWRWVTGEECQWDNWDDGEPNNSTATGKGEDALMIAKDGWWVDSPAGIDGQEKLVKPFVVEWETGAQSPPENIPRLTPLLPKKWKLEFDAPAKKGAGPWACWVAGIDPETGQRSVMKGTSLRTIMDGMVEELGGAPCARCSAVHFHWPEAEERIGWIGGQDKFPHIVADRAVGALYTTTLRLAEEQIWTFFITCDDFTAVRIPGQKWLAAHGDGFIDPVDPECLCREISGGASRVLGTMRIPAGDHRLEVAYGNRMLRNSISVLAARGEFSLPGETDKWRVPGWKAKAAVSWPGISDAGWKMTRTTGEIAGGAHRTYGLEQAAKEIETAKDSFTVPQINFMDSGEPGKHYFPNAADLPGDSPGQQDYQAISGQATLVIPEDGTWHIGFCSDANGALVIDGVKWKQLAANVRTCTLKGEAIYSRTEIAEMLCGEAELKKGEYTIQFLDAEDRGPMAFSIFGAPAGYPPRLLRKGGAGSEPDVDGLPLVMP